MSAPTDGPQMFEKITRAFSKSVAPDGEVLTSEVCMAVQMIAPVYDRLFGEGMVSNALKKDLIGNAQGVIDALLTNPIDYNSIDGLVSGEVKKRGLEEMKQDRYCGTVRLLWTKRAMEFIYKFLEKTFISMIDSTAKDAAAATYDEVLKPYHGWVVANLVTLVFSLCPTREQLTESLGFVDIKTAQGNVEGFVTVVKPIVDHIDQVLAKNKCNFDDLAAFY